MFETALRAHLVADAGISGLVSARVYPVTLPQSPTLPAIIYQLVTEPRFHTLEGAAAPLPYVQIDGWGKTMQQALDVSAAVTSCLDGFRGSLGGMIAVSACLQKSRRHFFDSETGEYRVSLDFSFWHN